MSLFLLSVSLFSRLAYASGDQEFTFFARGTEAITVDGLTVLVDQEGQGFPINSDEINKIFAEVIKTEFADKIDMRIVPRVEYQELSIDKDADEKAKTSILAVKGVLAVYRAKDLSISEGKDFGVLNITFSKIDLRDFWVASKIDPSIVNSKPLLFVVKEDQSDFRQQIRELFIRQLKERMTRLICFDGTKPDSCKDISPPPKKAIGGVSPPQ